MLAQEENEELEDSKITHSLINGHALSGGVSQTLLDDKPNYLILPTRKFEISELCELFFGRWSKYVYLILAILQLFLACVSFSSVAGSAWAVNIPFNFGGLSRCDQIDFMGVILPEEYPCRASYWFCLFLFACIVLPLSLLEPKEQQIVQLLLALLRFFTIGAMIVYCIVNLSIHYPFQYCAANETDCTLLDLKELFFKFDYKGWLVAIPVFVYANTVQTGIPSLTHPVKQKHLLAITNHVLYATFGALYLSLGLTVALWFGRNIIETSTLNWVSARV